MRGIGFGLERLGVLALTFPRVFTLLLVVMTGLCATFLSSVKFNGDVTAVIPRSSQAFLEFEQQKRDFRNFSRDVAIIIRSPRLMTAAGLEELRNLQLEMAIADGVVSALSVFSLPEVDRETNELGQFFPTTIESDEQAASLLVRLERDFPQAKNLIAPDANTAMLLVGLDLGLNDGNNAKAFAVFETMVSEVEEIAPDDFELLYAGLTPIGITILETLIKDQVKLTLFGLLLGALVAMAFFRCVGSAILCAIPPMLTAVWSIGFFGVAGIQITYLTTVLPTLALILAYADGIVLHHRWQQLNRKNPNAKVHNLREAVLRVGPASALTSITTAAAISSFALSSSEALIEFAWLGVILISFAFLTVIIALPIAGVWFVRMGFLRNQPEIAKSPTIVHLATRSFYASPVVLVLLALVALVPMVYSHFNLKPNYRVTDYLPKNSDTLKAEQIANDLFGGRSLMFFSIPVVEEGGLGSAKNRERMAEVTDLLASEYGEERVFSLHAVWKNFSEEKVQQIAQLLNETTPEIRQGYLSGDASRFLVSLKVPSSQSVAEGAVLVKAVETTISKLDYGDEVIVTGFPVLMAKEFTVMIEELRISLLVAVFIGILLIGIATRSLFYAAAAAIPNLFPILLLETFIYTSSGEISVTQVVALTLAFGISVDNAVHVINVLDAERKLGLSLKEALSNAIREVAPALAGSTLIICISTAVILMSALPILPIIGKLIIVILIVALVTNLVLLPANLLTLGRMFNRNG